MTPEARTRRYLIGGHVQGVGFRWFVCREAGRLDLRGFVRNLPDGRVEILASGREGALQELEGTLRRGPRGARVTSLDADEVSEEVHLPESFGIAH